MRKSGGACKFTAYGCLLPVRRDVHTVTCTVEPKYLVCAGGAAGAIASASASMGEDEGSGSAAEVCLQ